MRPLAHPNGMHGLANKHLQYWYERGCKERSVLEPETEKAKRAVLCQVSSQDHLCHLIFDLFGIIWQYLAGKWRTGRGLFETFRNELGVSDCEWV